MFAWTGIGLGFVVAAVLAGAGLVMLLRRMAALRTDHVALETRAQRRERVIEGLPDGYYLWDHKDGGEHCSPRLAVLLDLAAGTRATFRDVLDQFDGDELEILRNAVNSLRRQGRSFDVMLDLIDRRRHVQVIGRRAADEKGDAAADVIWMRDAAAPLSKARDMMAEGAALARQGQTLELLLDTVPLPMWIRNPTHDIVHANAATPPGFSGRALAARAIEKNRPQTETTLVETAQGTRRFTITEVPRPDGCLVGYGVPVNEIDRSALEVRFGSMKREPAILDRLPLAVAVFGADTRLGYFNEAYCNLWGMEADWLRSQPTYGELLTRLRERRRLPETADLRAYREKRLALFEDLDETQDSLLHLPDNATVRETIARAVDGGLVFAYEDMTERLELQSSFQTLVAVQRETLDNLHEGVAVFGADGRLQLSNPVFAQMWDLSKDDLSDDCHVADIVEMTRAFYSVEDWAGYRDGLIARLLSREPLAGRLERTDKSVLDYASVPLPDGGVLLSYIDATDDAQVERALRDRAEAVTATDRLKSEFIANLSYEVRTPLNSIIGFTDVLLDGMFGGLNTRQKEYGQGIHDAAQTLLALLNDVIDLASIEAGTLSLRLDSVDLQALLINVVGLIKERVKQRELDIAFDCPADIGWMIADERRLKQVLFHLLSNAVKFTRPGGTVTLAAARRGDEIALIVGDTGVGIPQVDQDRIFDSFEKGGVLSDGSAGAGLGLTMVRRFIELHDGRVEISSVQGEGTTVTCFLPAG